ncbi:MAG: hypothetical protein JOZ92_07750 [Candidatus Dormibacteraeota bacterium]|nr:hypothetical protein [Candidatus Dormibacteraeota bacterium]
MTAIRPLPVRTRSAAPRPAAFNALRTLAARRFALSVRTPRELVVPLLTPVLFALVIAPALRDALGATHGGVDYMSFVALATRQPSLDDVYLRLTGNTFAGAA